MKFFDLFSGIGGFRMALENAGHQCVGFCEIDKYAVQSYRAIYDTEGEYYVEDVTKLDPRSLPDFDILTAGFPCQSFSTAGKRKGFQDPRGTMFFEIARIVAVKKPKLLLLENVKGLLNHDRGETFRTILNTLHELGYDVEWQLCNSKDFGVGQNRERVFIVGHSRRECRRAVFPIRGTGKEVNHEGTTNKRIMQLVGDRDKPSLSIKDCAFTVPANPMSDRGQMVIEPMEQLSQPNEGNEIYMVGFNRKEGITKVLDETRAINTSDYRGLNRNQTQNAVLQIVRTNRDQSGEEVCTTVQAIALQNANMKGRRIKNEGEPSFTVSATDRHGVVIGASRGRNPDNPSDRTPGNYVEQVFEARTDEITNTITTVQKDNLLKMESRIRRLTPRECWRLQGFPDWAFDKAREAGLSDTQLYKQAGNAVTVNVVSAIALRLSETLK